MSTRQRRNRNHMGDRKLFLVRLPQDAAVQVVQAAGREQRTLQAWLEIAISRHLSTSEGARS